MKWIMCDEGETAINLENANALVIVDQGPSYTKPWQVIAEFKEDYNVVVGSFNSLLEAQNFLTDLVKM